MVPPIIFFLNVLIYKHVIAYADVIGRVLFHNIFSVVYVGFFYSKHVVDTLVLLACYC